MLMSQAKDLKGFRLGDWKSRLSSVSRMLQSWWSRAREPRVLAWLLLFAFLATLAVYKLPYTAAQTRTDVDGGYYTSVALHVRDGHGISTNLSLRHKGYSHFPHPTAIYPLWPLVFGAVAKVVPLAIDEVGRWLGTALYFATLFFGYLWGRRLFPEPLFPKTLPGFNAGHVFVLLFGINRNMFIVTSIPETEGLAFALLMAALWRLHVIFARPTFARGLEAGLWCGLVMMARTQLMLLAMGVVAALAWAVLVARTSRLAYLKLSGGWALGMGGVLALRYAQLRSFIDSVGVTEMIRFDKIYFTELLSRPKALRPIDGVGELLENAWTGLEVAFELDGRYAYARQYHTLQYALFGAAAVLFFLALTRARPARLKAAWANLREPANMSWVFIVIFALGAFWSMHVLLRYRSWYFARRHTLPGFFLMFLCLIFMLRRGPPARALGVLLLCSSLWLGGTWARAHSLRFIERAEKRGDVEQASLVAWLEQRARGDREGLIIAMRKAGRIAWRLPQVGFHHYDSRTTLDDIRVMVTHLGADYVVVRASDRRPLDRSAAFKRDFRLVGTESRHRIYAPSKELLAERARVADRG